MNNNNLVLKSINEMFGMDFHIPAYQRGYRWTRLQVNELLDDIWEFATQPQNYNPSGPKPFYCLQPVVVKEMENGRWEVIDGQQRLTTIYLVLKNLEHLIDGDRKNISSIDYQTRTGSTHYLKFIIEEQKDDNVDFYHIYEADRAIKEWFIDKANTGYSNARVKFMNPFIEDTKVIWYHVDNGENAIKIFSRLNIGKIPLTNAELIKALFLRKRNFKGHLPDHIRLKQLQIASEWDTIENTLQDNAFWYFISNEDKEYATRIEYIFDLLTSKNEDDDKQDQHYTFHKFNDEFEENPDIDYHWLKIKRYFQTFQEWFLDKELYHLVGFLIANNKTIPLLKNKSEELHKSHFKKYIYEEIQKMMNLKIDNLYYNDRRIKMVLLLFNIETILANKHNHTRFPFDSYKSDKWDIEHIRSVASHKPSTKAKQLVWLNSVLEYFTGETEVLAQQGKIEHLEGHPKEISETILAIKQKKSIKSSIFDLLYTQITSYFKESSAGEDINSMANLTLLDAATNRGYKNAVFPLKRNSIIKLDKNGSFIPLGTKNVFLKYYSKKVSDMMFWSEEDAKDYLRAIKDVLEKYLPKDTDSDNGSNESE